MPCPERDGGVGIGLIVEQIAPAPTLAQIEQGGESIVPTPPPSDWNGEGPMPDWITADPFFVALHSPPKPTMSIVELLVEAKAKGMRFRKEGSSVVLEPRHVCAALADEADAHQEDLLLLVVKQAGAG